MITLDLGGVGDDWYQTPFLQVPEHCIHKCNYKLHQSDAILVHGPSAYIQSQQSGQPMDLIVECGLKQTASRRSTGRKYRSP